MILPVYTVPQPILTQKAAPIAEITPAIRQLAADMRETMLNAQGVGIAAPQVGQSVALVVVELPDEDPAERIPLMTLVNPRVTWQSPVKQSGSEACLSIPGLEGPVRRPVKVRVKAQDLEGKPFEVTATRYLARVLQHEIDHLNGVLFTSLVPKGKLAERPLVEYPQI